METQKLISKLVKVAICLSLTGSSLLPGNNASAQNNETARQAAIDSAAIVHSVTDTAGSTNTIEKQDVLPEVTVAKETVGEVVLVRQGEVYRVQAPEDPEVLKNLNELSPEQQQQFLKNRTFALERMLSLLHWRHLKEGSGAILGQKIVQDQNNRTISEFSDMEGPQSIRSEVMEAFYQSYQDRVRAAGGETALFKQEAHNFMMEHLLALDAKLFRYAGLVSKPTEVGFSFTAGGTVGAGAVKKIWGRTRLLNFNIGIDFKTKSLVFEVTRINEKFSKNLTPLVVAGGVLAFAGVYAKNGQYDGTHRGTTISPPSPAPFGVLASGYSNYAEIGATAGASPLVIDFLAGFAAASERSRVLKIEFSPFRLGFLRVQFGPGMKETLVSVKDAIKRWFSPQGAISCRRVHRAS